MVLSAMIKSVMTKPKTVLIWVFHNGTHLISGGGYRLSETDEDESIEFKFRVANNDVVQTHRWVEGCAVPNHSHSI